MVYAIRLRNNPVAYNPNNPDNNILGEIGLGPPSSWTYGDIYTDRIRGGLEPGQTESGITEYVVAHEIGHGVHLDHCPDHTGLNCYMWGTDSVAHHVTQFHSHHLKDYDLKRPSYVPQSPISIPPAGKKRDYDPGTGTWSLVDDLPDPAPVVVTPDDETSDETSDETPDEITNPYIMSTNTGSSTYGCDYNAEYDWCSDTGTCTTRTGSDGIGMCGHRWCCCAPATSTTTTTSTTSTTTTTTTNVTSTNTGSSSYGCDYNAEYDYCTDTGTCTTRSGEFGIGMCGHRWCCCAPQ